MKVLVACETSGRVRQAFRRKGHDAWSCDLLPSDDDSCYHIVGDVLPILGDGWDLMVAHPPCTHLAVSGAAHFARKAASGVQQDALDFVLELMKAPIKQWAIENPVSIISSRIRKPDQIIQPWMFGDAEQKTTCLWLKGLPKLRPTNDVRHEMYAKPPHLRNRLHYLGPSKDRWKLRSVTYQGVAEAMADQWPGVEFQLELGV